MNRSQSKIRHIQEANILLEQRILNEQVGQWLTYPDDKNYQYQKQNGKWKAKAIKTGKIFDMSKYPSSVANLEKTFPGGKAPEGGQTSAATVSSSASTSNNSVSSVSSVNNTGNQGGVQATVDLSKMKGITYYGSFQDNAQGMKFKVANAIDLKCGVTELQLAVIGQSGAASNKIFYGYIKTPAATQTIPPNDLQVSRSANGSMGYTKDTNPCDFNKLESFGVLQRADTTTG
jgi:hypothetical protein